MSLLKKKTAAVVGSGRRKPSLAEAQPSPAEELTAEQIALYSSLTAENGFSVSDARRQFLGETSPPEAKRTRS